MAAIAAIPEKQTSSSASIESLVRGRFTRAAPGESLLSRQTFRKCLDIGACNRHV